MVISTSSNTDNFLQVGNINCEIKIPESQHNHLKLQARVNFTRILYLHKIRLPTLMVQYQCLKTETKDKLKLNNR